MITAKNNFLFIILFFLLSSCNASDSLMPERLFSAGGSMPLFREFDDVYEPSGVIQLNNGHLLIVEDEKGYPFSLLQLNDDNSFKHLPLSTTAYNQNTEQKIKLDDLEGITLGENNWIYAITSHSRTSKGKRKKHREKLVRFHIINNQIQDYQVLPSLTDAIARLIPSKSMDKLNIEGLAYDTANKSLLLGLRRPLINGLAIIIQIKALDNLFNTGNLDNLSTNILTIDLQGKSIRSIEYDPILQGYLIAAGSKKGRNDPFSLWLWKQNQISPLKISEVDDIGYTEGISTIKDTMGNSALLLVQDDGQRGQATGHYIIIPYDRLQTNQ